MTIGVRAILAAIVAALLTPPLSAQGVDVPGAQDAIEQAVAAAACDAAEQLVRGLPK